MLYLENIVVIFMSTFHNNIVIIRGHIYILNKSNEYAESYQKYTKEGLITSSKNIRQSKKIYKRDYFNKSE